MRRRNWYAGWPLVLIACVALAVALDERQSDGAAAQVTPASGISANPDRPPAPVSAVTPLSVPGRLRYRAARPGQLPADGPARVAGIALPAGHRGYDMSENVLPVWETDGPVDDAVALAARLANAFPHTGLWPVLWSYTAEDPAHYMDSSDDSPGIDNGNGRRHLRESALSVLTGQWAFHARDGDGLVYTRGFPGLARGMRLRAANPFMLFSRYVPTPGLDEPPYQLLLVACRRPADAITASGLELGADPGDPTNPQIASVLRSWEARFGANVVEFGMGWFGLAVSSPPDRSGAASRLARELFALNAPDIPGDSLAATTRDLLGGPEASGQDDIVPARDVWQLGWS